IIIVNREMLGIRHDYESIPYGSITSVRLEQGVITSSVFIRVQGYDTDKGLLKNGKEEGEIYGLHGGDAKDLANFLNAKIEARVEAQEHAQDEAERESARGPSRSKEIDSSVGGFIFCSKCGAKNVASAQFCAKCGAKIVSAH
ncbi:MAG TPA: zinc ribbon domain-containing protein, partial [Candidatus Acidoferrum sp.]|nr:zinc ribbon domain-containing protein [Candidatus Acidoferrum sp.]